MEAVAEFLRWINKPENVARMCVASGYLQSGRLSVR